MKRYFLTIVVFLLSLSIFGQSLVEKDSLYYLIQGNNTFPLSQYSSAKLFRYLVFDYMYIPSNSSYDTIFHYTNWSKEDQLKFIKIYEQQLKNRRDERRNSKLKPYKKLTSSDTSLIHMLSFQEMYGLTSNSQELVRDSMDLSKSQIKEILLCMEGVPNEYIPDPDKCTRFFRHKVVFYDKNKVPFDTIQFCITCSEYQVSSPINFGNRYRIIANVRNMLKALNVKYNEYGWTVKK